MCRDQKLVQLKIVCGGKILLGGGEANGIMSCMQTILLLHSVLCKAHSANMGTRLFIR